MIAQLFWRRRLQELDIDRMERVAKIVEQITAPIDLPTCDPTIMPCFAASTSQSDDYVLGEQ